MTLVKWAAVLGAMAFAVAATTLYRSFGAFLPWREDAEAYAPGAPGPRVPRAQEEQSRNRYC